MWQTGASCLKASLCIQKCPRTLWRMCPELGALGTVGQRRLRWVSCSSGSTGECFGASAGQCAAAPGGLSLASCCAAGWPHALLQRWPELTGCCVEQTPNTLRRNPDLRPFFKIPLQLKKQDKILKKMPLDSRLPSRSPGNIWSIYTDSDGTVLMLGELAD